MEQKKDGGLSPSSSSRIVQKQMRILKELQEQVGLLPKRLKTEPASQTEDELAKQDVKVECQQAVDEFKKNKFAFIQLLSRSKLLNYLENVPKEQWPTVESCDQESKHQLKDAKNEASRLEEKIIELFAMAQNNQASLESGLLTAQMKHKQVADKAAVYEQSVKAVNTSVAGVGDCGVTVDNFREKLEKQKSASLTADKEFTELSQSLLSLKDRMSRIKKQHGVISQDKEALERSLVCLASENERKERHCQDTIKQWEIVYERLSLFTGISISESSCDENCLVLELRAGNDEKRGDDMSALLSLCFQDGTEEWSPKQLASATINVDSLDIADLTEEAVRRNNPVFLVLAVMSRLKTHAPLFMEVEQLRHQYAIDWLSEQGILRAIFGDSGQIVCTLMLTAGQQGSTHIQLKSVEGTVGRAPIDELKPSQDSPSIAEWLKYLQDTVKHM